MENYVGYGFDVNEVNPKDWLALMRKFDKDEYKRFIEGTEEDEGVDGKDLEEALENGVEDWIGDISSLAEYLRDIINDGECSAAGTDYIVSAYDSFLVFDSIRFAGDPDELTRAKYIKSPRAFIRMIARYVPTKDLTFGNLYNGVEWADPNYFLD